MDRLVKTAPNKKPRFTEALFNRLTRAAGAINVTAIKAGASAMTLPLYTMPIKSHHLIVFMNALVSQMRCEKNPDLWLNIKKAYQKLLHKIGEHRVLSGSLMTMVQLAGQGNPSNGLSSISQERAVTHSQFQQT
jgi:hypothetical protein